MKIRNSIAALKDEFTAYRRTMHENPQTAYEEEFISNMVAERLTKWGVPFEREIGKTGIVATLEGEKTDSGRAIALRADMDALEIEEAANKYWRSKIPGKMHACGHDGHTAMLLGAAKYLSENRNFNGKVHFIFQPAEEGGRGAHRMIEEGLFERFPCDEVYAMHNWPHMPKGKIAMRSGPIMAGSAMFRLTVYGKGGHAAEPDRTVDPIVIASQIVTAVQTLVSRNTDPLRRAVVSITNFNAGTGAHNIIPDMAEIVGTIRTFDKETGVRIKEQLGNLARKMAEAMGAGIEYDYHFILDPTINDKEKTAFCAEIAGEILEKDNVDAHLPPMMVSEDFSAMLQKKPGAYIFIGQAEPDDPDSNHNHGLHTSEYDFNDDIIPIGIEYWAKLVEEALPLK